MNAPEWLKPGLYGAAVGAIALAIIGFNWGGWQFGGTVEQMMETANRNTLVTALAPICADKFERAAHADNSLVVELNSIDSWERSDHLIKAGWVTFPGAATPDSSVAKACATLLGEALKLK